MTVDGDNVSVDSPFPAGSPAGKRRSFLEVAVAHPSFCDDPECELSYAAHLNFHVAAAATPTRRRGHDAVVGDAAERQGEKDRKAFKAMAESGVPLPHVDGSAEVQARATSREHARALSNQVFHRFTRRDQPAQYERLTS